MKDHKRAKKEKLSLGTRDIAFVVRSNGKPEIHVPIAGVEAAMVLGILASAKAAIVMVEAMCTSPANGIEVSSELDCDTCTKMCGCVCMEDKP